jgi:hypothetical protein
MTFEERIRQALGEYSFSNLALQSQIAQLQEKLKEYEDKPQRKKTD